MVEKQDLAHIYTVSSLTKEIKNLLEERYPFVWVTGEISNFALPSSGHAYFSLKDADSIINGVMFRNQIKRLGFNPENGMKITALGRISLYEPRGSYQLIVEHMAPDGVGALQVRFEQLKKQLALEGLFDKAHKKPIPFLPSKISIITSPTGSVIRDIIQVTSRRFSGFHLEIAPVKVQGEFAEQEIKQAIENINLMAKQKETSVIQKQKPSELIIIARGGGSLEDLSPFNSETVARAVFASEIPVISAVGHETDFTICDFVADVRAPTPSAAAEIAVPEKRILLNSVNVMQNRLINTLQQRMLNLKKHLEDLKTRIKSPKVLIHDMQLRVDDLEQRLIHRMKWHISGSRDQLGWLKSLLGTSNPQKKIPALKDDIEHLTTRLNIALKGKISQHKAALDSATANLEALGPMAVLSRGYSITRRCRDNHILRSASEVSNHDKVEIILSKGTLVCEVSENSKKI
ncbi:Exodeoxyribonuclease 7 large subunit [Desulfamplus magnetovallimortis]|uniref:Exodeoxyribonuclease 7 large subunit n=1 Tax=Desulfamplus magnetovallimortis TaxID=1246637 RepID=L0R6J2_9BACT|nr:exodeoxyribonuclease VII large subunit [Desulfamplus magnetovallimortis]CCO06626.1 Exodeoxyribonuclease 7 large subunit [Desulfamplus magnetovallimortis BW-1]SLM32677.1 Exodeoxyribonuclease 7 large subunit [Desulfamplus magnetovallimortis]